MSQQTRDRLLDATFTLVSQRGLSRLALEDVAAHAGVSRQTLYRHFGSREGLIEALVLREEAWFIDRIVRVAEQASSAEEALAAGVTEALHAATEHPLLRRLLETEPGEILPVMVLGQGPVISAARPVVAELLADRLVVALEDVEPVADLCSRLMVSYVLDPGPEGPEVIGRRIARIVVHGVGTSLLTDRI